MWLALLTMMVACTAQHLGLLEAMADVAKRIASCPKCSSLWITLFVLLYSGYDIILAVGLSMLASYTSYWFGLLLFKFTNLYNVLWERLNKKK